jgi:hypothetical protein
MDEAGSWVTYTNGINHQKASSMDDACMTEALLAKPVLSCRGGIRLSHCYANVCTITGPATAVAGPMSRDADFARSERAHAGGTSSRVPRALNCTPSRATTPSNASC